MEKRTKCVRNHPTRSKGKSKKKIKKENKESKNPKPKKRT